MYYQCMILVGLESLVDSKTRAYLMRVGVPNDLRCTQLALDHIESQDTL